MKTLAILLIAASFLAGAFLASLDPKSVDWNWMIPVLLVGAIGLALHRRSVHLESRAGDKLSGNISTLKRSLDNIVDKLQPLHAEKAELPVYEARFEIDRLFREDLNAFANARESMVHVFGIQNYADVMSNFAAGERYLNRVWSASTDGYIDEVNAYLTRALDQFVEAREHFDELHRQYART